MDISYYQDDREPTPSELTRISELTDDQIAEVDKAIISIVGSNFMKVARVVGMVKAIQSEQTVHLPDIFFSSRVAYLVSTGRLESQGDLKKMRFSEVRKCADE